MADLNSSFEINSKIVSLLGWEVEVFDKAIFFNGDLFDPVNEWNDTGWLKEYLTIGSEGASAWGWSVNDCVGTCAETEQLAICLTAIKLMELTA